ncbi:MAG: CheR family methyltransferase, partial [Nitrososphaera sp.]|uniref:CheR family methyltransferase n=1 Tax=Nitrososphaera sp. TaxID=1971748 RepID=UPI003D6E3EFB
MSPVVEKAMKKGVDLRQYKDGFLKRRLDVRLKARDVSTYSQYARLLESDPAEFHALLATFSINVTEFFRDFEFYQAFYEKIIPDIYSRVKDGEVKAWSAGCASGEEPYSIAMLFAEAALALGRFKGMVIATDVSSKALERAKSGTYAQASVENVPEDMLGRHFARAPDGQYQVSAKVRSLVSFEIGNLSTMSAPQQVDVIFCRNVLMYFDKDTQYS